MCQVREDAKIYAQNEELFMETTCLQAEGSWAEKSHADKFCCWNGVNCARVVDGCSKTMRNSENVATLPAEPKIDDNIRRKNCLPLLWEP